MLSLTTVLKVTLFKYLLKDLSLYQNLILTVTLDHKVKAYFLFQAVILQDLEESVICSATLI